MKTDSVQSQEQKYLLLQNNYSISYTEQCCFINDKEYNGDNNNELSPKETAEILKQKYYTDFLKKHFKNLVFLTAAGTSLDNGENGGKSREGLWSYCIKEIDAIINYFSKTEFKDRIEKICDSKNIEALLSFLIVYEKIHTIIKQDERLLRRELEAMIVKACKLTLSLQAPHKSFLRKITARRNNDTRVQVFTTNYDTLFEQAANNAGFVIIDGFSFAQPREFSGKWFDLDIVNREKTRIKKEESFLSEVFHLYKLHGSLNWTKTEGKIIQNDSPVEPLIIYPADEKYESSYEQPYFEMMSRFQQILRKENTLLIVIGFGFQDKHINNVIIESLEQNPGFQLLIVNYNGNGGIDSDNLDAFFINKEKNEVKLGVNIVYDRFNDFTKYYPENNSYINELGKEDGAI
ncbi:MAG: SIR2 family protein [Bacteroidales bacterium]|jgi:NAD-dependent SIR2 family protein deacetylase|nr:SIR2 family protein [Bacteroidales bacterium]